MRTTPPPARRTAGHSLVEVSVALALAVVLAVGLSHTIGTTVGAQKAVMVQDAGTRIHQRTLSDIRRAAFSAVRVFGDGAHGRPYFEALDTTGAPPLIGSRLPVLDTSGSLDTDDVERRTGNALMLVVEEHPLDLAPIAQSYRVDVVRIVAFYLTRVDERVLAESDDRIDLVQMTSMPYVLRSSIDAVENDTERDALLDELVDLGYDRLVDLDADLDAAFFDVDEDGDVSATPVASPVIEPSIRFPTRRLLAAQRMSIARNGADIGVPRFALPDEDAPDFPSGFEVKVAGPWSAQRVLVRLALVTGAAGSHDIATDVTKVFTVGAR